MTPASAVVIGALRSESGERAYVTSDIETGGERNGHATASM